LSINQASGTKRFESRFSLSSLGLISVLVISGFYFLLNFEFSCPVLFVNFVLDFEPLIFM